MTGRRRRGFTLVEALVSMLVMGICIGLMADLYAETIRAVAFQEVKEDAGEGLSATMNQVSLEVQQACRVVAPSGSSPSSELVLEALYGADSTGGLPMPAPVLPTLPRYETVNYVFESANGLLRRHARGRSVVVAENLEEFQVSVSRRTTAEGGPGLTLVKIRATAPDANGQTVTAARQVPVRTVPLPDMEEIP